MPMKNQMAQSHEKTAHTKRLSRSHFNPRSLQSDKLILFYTPVTSMSIGQGHLRECRRLRVTGAA